VRLVTTKIDSDAVLDYWLGSARYQADAVTAAKQRWYKHGHRLDTPINNRFADLLSQVSQDKSMEIHLPEVCAAKVIVLDQFSRHIFRGSPAAWQNDSQAQNLALAAVNSNHPHQLTPSEQLFLWHPLHHSEDLPMQNLAISLLKELLRSASQPWQQALDGFLPGWQSHAAIITEFGRFPHRNNILGRVSTKKELLYLSKKTSNYGQN